MKKKLLTEIICTALIICTFICTPFPASAALNGDINSSGAVDILDVLALLNQVTSPSANPTLNGDVDGSGAVDILDVLALLKQVTSPSAPAPTQAPDAQKPIETASNTITVNDEDFTTVGRYHLNYASNYTVCNSGAGIAFAMKGTSLEVKLASSAYNSSSYTYAAVYIDEREPIAIKVTASGWYTVATDLEPDVLHDIRILKRSESNCGTLILDSVRLSEGGVLYTAKPYPTDRKIQVLGDSITCGYGNLYYGQSYSGYTDMEDGTYTYATILGERYGAELDVTCISGIGLGTADNEPWPILPSYKKDDSGANGSFDFAAFVPDVVIIALGTNDDAQGATAAEVKKAGTELVEFIRSKYPDAHIIWSYGIMSTNSMTAISELISELQQKGDTKLHFLPTYPNVAAEGIGLYSHPNTKTHERMADELSVLIEQLTGWTSVQ